MIDSKDQLPLKRPEGDFKEFSLRFKDPIIGFAPDESWYDSDRYLVVGKRNLVVSRTYGAPGASGRFGLASRAEFWRDNEKGSSYRPARIERQGARLDRITIDFEPNGNLHFDTKMGDWTLEAKWNQGSISNLSYSLYLFDEKRTNLLNLRSEEIERIKRGEEIVAERNNTVIHAVPDEERKRVVLKWIEGEKTMDEVTVPIHLETTEVQERLFPKAVFEDAYNAPASEDGSWLNTDLLQACNIKRGVSLPKFRP